MNHEAWAGVLLAEAGGHNPHHALVPVLAGEDQGAAVLGPEALDLLGGVGADGLLYRLPLPGLGHTEPLPAPRPGGVIGLQQVRGQIRRAHAAGGVDPGGQHKADLDRGDGLAQKPRLLQQGVDATKSVWGRASSPQKAMVRFSPSIRITSAMVPMPPGAVSGEQGILPALAPQGQHQLQRHTHSRQMLEG